MILTGWNRSTETKTHYRATFISPCIPVENSSTRNPGFRFQKPAINPLTPKDFYSGRTATLTSKRRILYIYSTNTDTEYFKHDIYCPFFPLQNAVCFIILTYLVPVFFSHFIYRVC